ncbi:hypothetical protein EMIHUDRAFT_245789 [Emiliania huxleyi CCMP1516]|uniref:Uncharacterized protein n=2 Tax=Emiliania huxleyi TaxID=2903 RepID=A0A0D3IW89_EMIH1|nr:hypothetical protein EMIHUDRAFT_245789 [Emiliania huxleyi CCMP1516]EOD15524.1 hypothetical protein EMIHUDRAFT_245789 [Emiliania huxleyi CCMP1516]|eukprot:XP_005767953.1 hypothetical protein EMIHUDRAFT_245789 [Emiliania huxleyi CCMP1516]
MAEGAIDGEAKAYEMSSAHSTHFAFSRYYNLPPEPSQQPTAPAAGSEASTVDAEASAVDAPAEGEQGGGGIGGVGAPARLAGSLR